MVLQTYEVSVVIVVIPALEKPVVVVVGQHRGQSVLHGLALLHVVGNLKLVYLLRAPCIVPPFGVGIGDQALLTIHLLPFRGSVVVLVVELHVRHLVGHVVGDVRLSIG